MTYRSLDETLKELDDIQDEVLSRLNDPFLVASTKDYILQEDLRLCIPKIQRNLLTNFSAAARNEDEPPLASLSTQGLIDRTKAIAGKAADLHPL